MKLERALAFSAALTLVAAGCDGTATDPGASGPVQDVVAANAVKGAPSKKILPTRPEQGSAVRKIALMEETIEKIQGRLQSCLDLEVCKVVLGHSFLRASSAQDAKTAAQNRDWKTAGFLLGEVKGIVQGDIELLEGVEKRGSIGDVLGLERALLNQTDAALDAVAR